MAILAATPSQKRKWGADQNEGEDRKWGETIKKTNMQQYRYADINPNCDLDLLTSESMLRACPGLYLY